MAGTPIDPFRASKSITESLPDGAREHIEARLSLPASRRDLLDLATANSHLFVLVSAVLVAVKTGNNEALELRVGILLDELEKFSDLTRHLTTRLLVADELGRVGEEQEDG